MKNRLLVFLLLVVWLSFPGEMRAQAEIVFSGADIELWPEFDRPEMLVIINLQLAEEVPLPVELTLRIPAKVGNPHALADSVDGDKSYTREVVGEWAAIKFTALGRVIRLEYYDEALSVENPQRRYEFIWQVDYPTLATRVNIKLPEDVRSVTVPLSFGDPESPGDGYIYYETFPGSFEAGDQFSTSLSYTRGVEYQSLLAWGLGLVGATLLIWGGYRYFKTERPSKISPARRRSSRQKPSGTIYCHTCGQRSNRGDKFCRNCGERLRKG